MFSFFSSNNFKGGIAIIILIAVVFGLFLGNTGEIYAQEDQESQVQKKEGGILQNLQELAFIYTLFGGGTTGATQAATYATQEWLGSVAESIFKGLAYLSYQIAARFLGIIANVFSQILDFTVEMLKGSAVYIGWGITRDIVNMFFILGLIVIAFATILKIESYGMKSLLPKLIIIAILINFSFLACGIIVDASHIVTNVFLDSLKNEKKELGVGGMLVSVMFQEVKEDPSAPEGEGVAIIEAQEIKTTDFTEYILAAFSVSGVMFMSGLVLLVGTVLLIIRIAALWILIIFAPFAWFFGVFPSLKHMNSKWWNNFLKYAFFVPIFVFMLYLGVNIIKQLGLKALAVDAPTSFLDSIKILAEYLISVIILLGAPVVAMNMGIHGSQAVVAAAKRAGKGAVGVPTRAAWRKFERSRVGKAIPGLRASREAWKQRREEKERKAYKPAIGAWRDRFNRVFDRKKTFYEQREKDLAIDSRRADLRKQDLSPDALVDRIRVAKKTNDMEEFEAGMLELISQKGDKQLFSDEQLGAQYGHEASPKSMQQFIKDSISDKREAITFTSKFQNAAEAAGLHQYSDMVKYDPQKKIMDWNLQAKLGEKGGEKIMQTSPSERWKKIDSRIFFNERQNKPVEVTNSFKTILKNIEREDINKVVEDLSTTNKKLLTETENEPLVKSAINEIRRTDPQQASISEQWLEKIKQSLAGEGGSKTGEGESKIVTETSEKEFKKSREKHEPGAFG